MESKKDNNESSKSNVEDKLASHRTSYFIPKHKSDYSASSDNTSIIRENTPSLNDTLSENSTNNTAKSSRGLVRKHSKSIISSKSPLEEDHGGDHHSHSNNNNTNGNSLAIPSLCVPDTSTAQNDQDQNDIFMPPQIILSFQDDDLENEIANEINNKIIYSSHEGYSFEEEKVENNFENLDKIINFGNEKEPETDTFSVMRSKQHGEDMKEGEELELKKKNSIKYADSGVKFSEFDDDNDNNNPTITTTSEPPQGSTSTSKNEKADKSSVHERKSSIPPSKTSNANNEVPEEKKSPIFPKKASLQTPSILSSSQSLASNKRGRRYSAMAFVPIKDNRINGDNLGPSNNMMYLTSDFLSSRHNDHSEVPNSVLNKYSMALKEFIPQRGLLYSEFQKYDSGWVLCKPKLLPLKSLEIQKIEKMEKAMYKARQNTGLRLTRTASVVQNTPLRVRSNEVHTSPSTAT